jgi:signal peptidase II
MPRQILGLFTIALTFLADQISKAYMFDHLLNPPREIIVTSFLKFVPVWNRGISFGLLQASSETQGLILVGVTGLIVLYLLFWLWKETDSFQIAGLGLIIGGAIGNIVDRLRFGAVKDFLYFYIDSWAWPAFNLADSCIVIGVGLLILRVMLLSRNAPKA